MRLFTRTLMFLACLIYGMMPGMAADMSMPVMGTQASDEMTGEHSGHATASVSDPAKSQTDPCPHKGSMTHAPLCAACLVLLPELTFAEKGMSPQATPLPHVQVAFVGDLPAPLLPPPRT